MVLGPADIGKQRLGRKVFITDVKLRHGILDDPDGIIGIVDGEVAAVSQHLYFRPQDAGAGCMEGGGMDVLPAAAEHPGQSCAQLPCGFIGEGDGQNIPRGGDIVGDEPRGPFHIAAVGGAELQGVPVLLGQGRHIILPGGGQAVLQKIGDAVDEDGGFSAAGPGQNENRALHGHDCLPLHGVEVGKAALQYGVFELLVGLVIVLRHGGLLYRFEIFANVRGILYHKRRGEESGRGRFLGRGGKSPSTNTAKTGGFCIGRVKKQHLFTEVLQTGV